MADIKTLAEILSAQLIDAAELSDMGRKPEPKDYRRRAALELLRLDALAEAHQAEVARLTSELDVARGVLKNSMQCSNDLLVELDALKSAQAGAEEARDAERYRWLREQTGTLDVAAFSIYGEFIGCEPAAIDEAIDAQITAARAASQGKEGV